MKYGFCQEKKGYKTAEIRAFRPILAKLALWTILLTFCQLIDILSLLSSRQAVLKIKIINFG
jgi:hypothetical protein